MKKTFQRCKFDWFPALRPALAGGMSWVQKVEVLAFVGDLPGHFEEQQVLHRQRVLLPGRQQPAQGRHGQGARQRHLVTPGRWTQSPWRADEEPLRQVKVRRQHTEEGLIRRPASLSKAAHGFAQRSKVRFV